MHTPKSMSGYSIAASPRCASRLSITSEGLLTAKRPLDEEELPIEPVRTQELTRKSPDADAFSEQDVHLIIDFFNIPFEYGERAAQMIDGFRWLRDHADALRPDNDGDACPSIGASFSPVQLELEAGDGSASPNIANAECVQMRDVEFERPPSASEWRSKAIAFREAVQRVNMLTSKVMRLQNRPLAYDLNPYLTELYGTLWVCRSYVDWLAARVTDARGCRQEFFAGEHEPWLIRGGVLGELQRAVPEHDWPSVSPSRPRPRPRAYPDYERSDSLTRSPKRDGAEYVNSNEKQQLSGQGGSRATSVIRPAISGNTTDDRQCSSLGAPTMLRYVRSEPRSTFCYLLKTGDDRLEACCIAVASASSYRSFASKKDGDKLPSPFVYLKDSRYPAFITLLLGNERPSGEVDRLLQCTLDCLRATSVSGVYTAISAEDARSGVFKRAIFEKAGFGRHRGDSSKTSTEDAINRMDSDGQPERGPAVMFLARTL